MDKWSHYFATVGCEPNPLVSGALRDFVRRGGICLDLGAGNLRDAIFVQSCGFEKVVAVDSCPHSKDFLVPGIELHIMPIEDFIPDVGAFDLIYSCNTFFFLSVADVARVCERAVAGLRTGGVLLFNVLGKDDGWVQDGRKVSSFTPLELRSMCGELFTIKIGEERRHKPVLNEHGFASTKFWHLISIAARKL